MFDKIINALLGAFRITPDKTKPFTEEHNKDFIDNMKPGTVYLIGGDGFIPDGIQGAENSFWCHTMIYIGEEWGNKIRAMFPALMSKKQLPGMPTVGEKAHAHEIIEAEGDGIRCDTLDKYLGKENQMVGHWRSLTEAEMICLFRWFYDQVGKPYGYPTFLTELFPVPSDIPVTDLGYICSGLAAVGYWINLGIRLASEKIHPAQASPADLWDGLRKNMQFMQTRWNW